MRDLAHNKVKGVLQKLYWLLKKFGVNEEGFISFAISRRDIASYTGTAYETVYKLLMEFTESGFIKTDGKDIAILNKEGRMLQWAHDTTPEKLAGTQQLYHGSFSAAYWTKRKG